MLTTAGRDLFEFHRVAGILCLAWVFPLGFILRNQARSATFVSPSRPPKPPRCRRRACGALVPASAISHESPEWALALLLTLLRRLFSESYY